MAAALEARLRGGTDRPRLGGSRSDRRLPGRLARSGLLEHAPHGVARALHASSDLALGQASAFESFRPGVGSAPYHLKFTMNNHGSIPLAILSGAICGATLTLVPAYARDYYTLTIEIRRDDVLLKTYVYDDYKATWICFFLLPIQPWVKSSTESVAQTFDNMVLSFVQDVKRDGLPHLVASA